MAERPSTLYLGLDCGSSSVKGLLYDPFKKRIRARERIRINTSKRAEDGCLFIEQSPQELLNAASSVLNRLLRETTPNENVTIGIASQRSSFLLAETQTGRALTAIISWQDTRGLPLLKKWRASREPVYEKTGLYLTPYYTITKLLWILRENPCLAALARKGLLKLCYLPSYLLLHLSREQRPAIDASLAQRSLLLNCQSAQWDRGLLQKFAIPRALLPELRPTYSFYGTLPDTFKKPGAVIRAVIGDQQAAFLALNAPGGKTLPLLNLGTGGFVLIPTKSKRWRQAGLLTDILRQKNNRLEYLLEGTVTSIQGAFKWLISIGLMDDEKSFHPPQPGEWPRLPLITGSFGGLASPHWRGDLKVHAHNLDASLSRDELLLGFLLNTAHLFWEILHPLRNLPFYPKELAAAGGLSKSRGLLEIMAQYLEMPIVPVADADLTALGAIQAASNDALRIPIEKGPAIRPNFAGRNERERYRRMAHRELLKLINQ
ncbi:MAG: hypothetical protein HY547_07925 [Elusimicrobia bacterium]|nr:hypothetical protein [Elusimicrobiota bacterium]